MSETIRLVVFTLDRQALALPLAQVERVVQAVAVTKAADVPETVLGVVNVQGRALPALDIRKRFGLPAREQELSDQFLLARTATRSLALVADMVRGVIECSPAEMPAEPFLPGLAYVDGVVHWEGEMILICNLDKLFSADEEARLNALASECPEPEMPSTAS